MLQFLQTGKVMYVLAAVCLMGVISKLVTSRLYKRLIRETGNMALTKNKNLKALKQKTENMFLVSPQGIRNTTAYIDRQVYGFRFMKIPLESWNNASAQSMILSFLIGGTAAFGAYWYQCDSYYIVLYGTMGILMGLFLIFVDNGANIAGKRQQLEACLVDYVENSPHFHKTVDKLAGESEPEKKGNAAFGAVKPRVRELGRKSGNVSGETGAVSEAVVGNRREKAGDKAGRFHIEKSNSAEGTAGDRTEKAQGERQGSRLSVLPGKKEAAARGDGGGIKETQEEDELSKSICYLKQSLDQIAASRDMNRQKEEKPRENDVRDRVQKELRPEDIRLLGDILQEYMK